MKTKAIPFFAALGCTLTACGDKENEEIEDTNVDTDTEDTDTEDTDTEDTEDTEVELGDISEVIGLWTLDSYSYTGYYGETYQEFPATNSDTYEGYGVLWTNDTTTLIFFDIDDAGSVDLVVSESYTTVLSIDGTEIYNNSVGYSDVQEAFATVREDGGSYPMELDGASLNCTLTGAALTCEGDLTLNLTSGGEIPEDFDNSTASWPETPSFIPGDCIDAPIVATGDAVQWGGFDESAGDDFAADCAQTEGYFDFYTYTYVEGEPLVDTEEFVFSFEAPNDGCFSFNTTGTNFTHGIQLLEACDGEVLSCTTTGAVEHGLEAGETVLVVIDGEGAEEQLFNISISEVPFDASTYDEVPEDTSAIDTTSWTEEVDACAPIGAAKTYIWTAPATGTVTFDTTGSDFDTVLQVQVAECGGTAECNDDIDGASENYQSLLTLEVEEGVGYMVTVGGYSGDSGTLTLTVTYAE